MKRTTLVFGITSICLFSLACSTKVVKGTVSGIEVTVQSQRRTKEYKPPGSGTGYGQIRSLQSGPEKEFLVIELKAPRKIEFGDKGIKARVKDDKGQTYNSVYSEVFGFNDERTEAKILFEIPEHAVLPTLMLDDTSFDLSKVIAPTTRSFERESSRLFGRQVTAELLRRCASNSARNWRQV